MKKALSTVLKGFTAILLLQLAAFVIIVTVQSCKKTDTLGNRELQKNEINTFKNLLKTKKSQFGMINSVRQKDHKSSSIMRTPNSGLEDDPNGWENTLGEDYNVGLEITPEYASQCEIEVRPIYDQSNVVIASYGITQQDLIEEWGVNYDPELIIHLGIAIAAYEELDSENGIVMTRNSIFLITPIYAKSELYQCIKEAIGFEGVIEVLRTRALSTYAGKKLLIKAIGKFATRSLGWVGAAWAVADFIDCYY